MLSRVVFALLLVLVPLGAHASFRSSALTSGAQASDSSDALAAPTGDLLPASGSRELLAKKKSKGKGKGKKPSPPPKRKPSPPPKRKPSPPAKKPSPKPVTPAKKPPTVPQVVRSPPLPPSPPPPTPSPPPPPPKCPLTVGGVTVNFKECDSVTWSDIGTIYFSLEGEILTLGYRGAAATQGWVSVALTPTFKMSGSDAVVTLSKSDGSVAPQTMRINGYNPSTYAPTAVYSDVTVGKSGDVLAGIAKLTWPVGVADLPLSFTAGKMNPTTGNTGIHYKTPVIKKISRTTLTVVA